MAKAWPSVVYDADDLRAARPAPAPVRRSMAARSYAGAKNTRFTGGFGNSTNASADYEISTSLIGLRSRSRQLMRDAPYAKRAHVIIVNNVIGPGVGLQAQVKNSRRELHTRINDGIEAAFACWSRASSCHTGGALHLADLERAAMGQVVDAGEVIIRMHPVKFGDSKVPLALELIEPERIADDLASTQINAVGTIRMGIETDKFGRAIAYWIRDVHPGELRSTPEQSGRITRVPAEEIIHLRIIDRWPQTRGVPWLHAAIRKLNDMEEYTGSELTAARLSANYFATIESPEIDPLPNEEADDGAKEINIEPGVIEQLSPGDELKFHAPNRPNAALDPFMRYMVREFAAAANVSYASVSSDYSQSNYSSSRLALLDDRDLWRTLQQWWARTFRAPLHARFMQAAVLAGQIPAIPLASFMVDPEPYEAVRWKFRGWSWIDPTKEVEAAKSAVRAGFTTVTAVIAESANGRDIEDVIAERKNELEMFEEAEVRVETTVEEPLPVIEPPAPKAKQDDEETQDDEEAGKPARVFPIREVAHA